MTDFKDMSPDPADGKPQLSQPAPHDTRFAVADFGGTNARFAMYSPDGQGTIQHHDPARFQCRDFDRFEDALQAYLDQLGYGVDGACISIAAPVDGDRVNMTNLDWAFSISECRKKLGLQSLMVINDGVAAALATTGATPSQTEVIKTGDVDETGSRLNLIPGTGFGLGCIIPHKGDWVPVKSEGGHATVAAVAMEEFAVLRQITETTGRAVGDRVLSGPGMFNIYRALAVVRGQHPADVDAREMTELALNRQDQLSTDALDLYITLLGRLAGDLALTLNAHGGVYLSGSLLQRIGAERIRERFNDGFMEKDKMADKVKRIPVNLLCLRDQCLWGASVWINSNISSGSPGV